ncbi:MAG: copper homeostasis protein CutC [Micromonosporaceae bacterium]
MDYRYEVCVDSVAGVRNAERGGAHRVELCSGLFEGGLTPSVGLVTAALAASRITTHVLIRPRGGDFCYDAAEREAMLTDISAVRDAGAHGVVVGALTPDGDVDVPLCRELVAAAGGLSVTFHRAFDLTRDPATALEDVIGLGVRRLLTSGQDRSALDGALLIQTLVRQAGDRLTVMAGGGVTPRNVRRIVVQTGVRELHFSAGTTVDSPVRHRNPSVHLGGTLHPPEYARTVTDEAAVRAITEALN